MPVPVLAKQETRKGRLWAYVRDDKPFAGPAPPAAVFFYSRDRTAQHPESHLRDYAGILQADAYAGFNRLYEADRKPGPITEASCWAHGRRKFFELADVTAKARGKLAVIAPLAFEAVKRIDAIFDIERTNNAAERALRRIALGRKSWLFAYSSSPWRHRCGARACHIPRAARSRAQIPAARRYYESAINNIFATNVGTGRIYTTFSGITVTGGNPLTLPTIFQRTEDALPGWTLVEQVFICGNVVVLRQLYHWRWNPDRR